MAYIATICILVDVETETDCMDAIAESMRELMQPFAPTSVFRDWMWDDASKGNELVETTPIPSNFQMDDVWPHAKGED